MTAQIHEALVLDGQPASMAFCPPLPVSHPRISEREVGQGDDPILSSTGCWRRYQGSWEIRDNKLYLVGIKGRFVLSPGEPLFADWFTGTLRVPQGELVEYVHMGFGSVYAEELHIRVENGEVVGRRVVDNRGRDHDLQDLTWANLPGGENRFAGDDDW